MYIYEGIYCVYCEEYQDEKELLDNDCCPMHLKSCVLRKVDNYYFALSKYKKFLEKTLTQNLNFFQPSFRLNEVQRLIKSGLRDLFPFPEHQCIGASQFLMTISKPYMCGLMHY